MVTEISVNQGMFWNLSEGRRLVVFNILRSVAQEGREREREIILVEFEVKSEEDSKF